MVVKSTNRTDIERAKLRAELRQLGLLQDQLVDHIKISIGNIINIEYLYDLKEFIDDVIESMERINASDDEDDDTEE